MFHLDHNISKIYEKQDNESLKHSNTHYLLSSYYVSGNGHNTLQRLSHLIPYIKQYSSNITFTPSSIFQIKRPSDLEYYRVDSFDPNSIRELKLTKKYMNYILFNFSEDRQYHSRWLREKFTTTCNGCLKTLRLNSC